MTKITKVENVEIITVEQIKQKRGRKPKNILITNNIVNDKTELKPEDNNIVFLIQESNTEQNNETNNETNNEPNTEENNEENTDNVVLSQDQQKPAGKKRGRKPKGGKIIQQVVPLNNNKDTKPNIILHLKCSLKDLQINSSNTTNIESFHFLGKNDLNYEVIQTNNEKINQYNSLSNNLLCDSNSNNEATINDDDSNDICDDEFY